MERIAACGMQRKQSVSYRWRNRTRRLLFFIFSDQLPKPVGCVKIAEALDDATSVGQLGSRG